MKNNSRKQPGLSGDQIVLGILQGEKAFAMIEKQNKYCFFVPCSVNKIDIAKWFEMIYGKTPVAVNTMVLPSKNWSRRLKRRSYKKAIITLAKDDKIDIV